MKAGFESQNLLLSLHLLDLYCTVNVKASFRSTGTGLLCVTYCTSASRS